MNTRSSVSEMHFYASRGSSEESFKMLSAVKTYRPRLRGSRRHNWIHRRLTSRAWTSSDPLGCTLRLCLMPLHRAICTRAIGECTAASAAVTWPVYTCHSYRITRHYLSNLYRVAPLRYLRFNKLQIVAPAPTL